MRLVTLACLAALGCSSTPQDEDPAQWRYTKDSAVAPADDGAPGPAFDAAVVPDAYAPQPDASPVADTAPPPDTYTCKPATTCTTTTPDATPCGFHADGCGGMVPCDVCPTHRKCVTSTSEPPTHCGCKLLIGGVYCVTKAGVRGGMWECPADATPLGLNANWYSNPDGTKSWWCMGKGD